FHLIGEVEARLPFPFYDEEWNKIGRGQDKTKYRPITHVEQYVPILFAAIYATLFVVGAILLVLNTTFPL
ncbi:MAG: RipA family octameric membrane protein, partial [Halobacteriota archaeon]